MRSKFPPRDAPDEAPGWYCYAKKGGCGANFSAGDQTIEGQSQGRVENDDVATVINTVLKMAKKRATVDAALSLARCSDMFTQDAEDLLPDTDPRPANGMKKPEPAKTGEDKPDRALVESYLELFAETRNKDEAFDVWGKVKVDPKLTPEGREFLKVEVYAPRYKSLPKAVTAKPATPTTPTTPAREPGDEPTDPAHAGLTAGGSPIPF
jgi:hypothetical protein